MSTRRISLLLCLSAAAIAAPAARPQSPKTDEAVAKINGHVLTRAEFNQKAAANLLEQRYVSYRADRDALERLINDDLLAQEAKRRNLTAEQLLQQEADGKVKDPTDAELRVFYEGAQTEQPYESVRAQLLTRVHQTRIKKAREAYLNSLRATANVKILLPPPYVEIGPGNTEPRGPKNAPVALIEFADFECPFCREMQPQIERLVKNYNGKVALYFRDFPLPIHAHAEKSSEAARCAGQQGALWPYHDLLFRNDNLDTPKLKEYARALRLDAPRFDACLDSGAMAAAVKQDADAGTRIGVNGTPAFFINGHFLSGVVTYETLVEIVEQQLNSSAPVVAVR